MYLDSFSPHQVQVGYGQLGLEGSLGYEDKPVMVRGQRYPHALSSHAPSRLLFHLGGRYRSFHCHVALNGDVGAGISHADFILRADGRLVACEPHVVAGEPPHLLHADITGTQTLELITETTHWEYCHSVWLDPGLGEEPIEIPERRLVDPLGRVEISLLQPMPSARRCIGTVVSTGFEKWADNMLGSLRTNGECGEARLVLFAVEANAECERIARKYDALLVHCRPRTHVGVSVKAILYSIARVIPAEQYLCLDADMFVLGSIAPIFDALEAAPLGSMLVCREANHSGPYKLAEALVYTYFGKPADLRRVLGSVNGEGEYPLVVNDGMFAGTAAALRAIDGVIRGMPQAIPWMEERHRVCWWRNQFIFNLALARLHCGVEVDGCYNVQLHTQDVEVRDENRRVQAAWRGRSVRILHFCGIGKRKYPQLHQLYAG
jgi:hypothetical protein